VINWFPLCKNMMEESQEFRKLTPAEKLYYWLLISEYNRHKGEFYKSDLETAVTLGISVVKVRQARRKLQSRKWLEIIHGFRTCRNKNVATRYLCVSWAVPADGEFFAQMHRFAFEVMLAKVRHREFTYVDVAIYIYLAYLFWKNRGKNESHFYITKNQLRKLTDIPDAPTRVERLYQHFIFSGGKHLFEYRDQYHRLLFTGWSTFVDPSEDENNKKLADGYRQEIKNAVATAKKNMQKTAEKQKRD